MQMFTMAIVIFLSINSNKNNNNVLVQARVQWRGANSIFKGRGGGQESIQDGSAESSTITSTTTTTTTMTKTRGMYEGDSVYEIETTTTFKKKKQGSKGKKATSTTTTTTKAAELIQPFEKTLVAVDRQKTQDLHVGNLLAACQQLEDAMRKAGLSQIANDIAGNMKKVRTVYDRFPKHQRDSVANLVQYEMENGIHGSGHYNFKENSATMGLLWLGRTINYLSDFLGRMLNDETVEPYAAAMYAYERNVKSHLSWTMQKVCQAAMNMLKPVKKNTIYSRMGGFEQDSFDGQEEEATKQDLRRVLATWEPLLFRCKQTFLELDLVQI